MIRVLGTVFAALLGLAFGSFLNVCLSRWPQGESIVHPRSHCRQCARTLVWWENVPLASWLVLRGRCRTCGAWIGWRYVVVEIAVGGLWAVEGWRLITFLQSPELTSAFSNSYLDTWASISTALSRAVLNWLLVALAVLDVEHLWLPDRITLPGMGLGFIVSIILSALESLPGFIRHNLVRTVEKELLGILGAAALIVLIRWVYWLIRRGEGLGLGDAKLMGMLAAWLGFSGAMLSFGIGVVAGALLAVLLLLVPHPQRQERWAVLKMPLGTFLCIGGIVTALWGNRIIAAYLRWTGF